MLHPLHVTSRKSLGEMTRKIVSDGIAKDAPAPENFFAQESEHRVGEFLARGIALFMRYMLLYYVP